MVPLTIEMELGDAGDAFLSSESTSWEITRPRLLASVCQVDQALANSYAKHILDGRSLPMYFGGVYSVRAAIPAASTLFSFPIARGFTRLRAVLVSLYYSAAEGAHWNTYFYNPLEGAAQPTETTDSLRWNMTIGSERYPNFDCESTQESWYRLRLALGGADQPLSISGFQYSLDRHVFGQTFEKVPGSGQHTGINTRSGSQLTINLKGFNNADMIHCVLLFDEILNVSAAGCEVLD